jgi:hypothetical protein
MKINQTIGMLSKRYLKKDMITGTIGANGHR